MNINQPTLSQFERYRREIGFIPPYGSNMFFDVGPGRINLFTLRNDPSDFRFDIFTDQDKVYTGPGIFHVSGDLVDPLHPYRNMTIITGTSLTVNQTLAVERGEVNIHGTLELIRHSQLRIRDGANVTFHQNSVFVVPDLVHISVTSGSTLTIYGRIDIHISRVPFIRNVENIIIDSAAVLNIYGIENVEDRFFSLKDYDMELRERFINVETQGEKNFQTTRFGHIWREGSPREPSQVIGLSLLLGEAPLGDFRFPVLGRPNETTFQMQTVSDLIIRRNTVLHITEDFNGHKFYYPELYLGVIIGNTRIPAECVVEGTIIADGENSLITVDRRATLRIRETGEIHLKNGAIMRSTHNDDTVVLFIDGTLIIDDISQIETFEAENIKFGPNGKVIILNPSTEEKRVLFTTPDGILESDLYRIFSDTIDHVEYHVTENTGIGIDRWFENYSRDMTQWFGHRRFEKAIYDGILIWYSGAFIELYHHITPWIDETSSLIKVGNLFKSFGSTDIDRLQDSTNRLRYAGCKNILFRFVNGENVGEVLYNLEEILMRFIMHNPVINNFILTTNNNGSLFLRNRVSNASLNNLIHERSRVYDVPDTNQLRFTLP